MTLQLRRDASPIKMRNYGRIVQNMIAYAAQLEPGKERDSLEVYIAQCMRQRNILWNRDQETGVNRVKEDIIKLSNGRLTCSSPVFDKMSALTNTPTQKKKKGK